MDRLYEVDELAAILRVKASTVYTWVRDGKIPHMKLGRLIRFNSKQIVEITGTNEDEGGSVPLQN